jgi:transcription elongation GreA/GreB family factor
MVDEERRRRILDVWQCNLDHVVRFEVEGMELVRRLVAHEVEAVDELNVASAVGRALRNARPGDRMSVEAPGGCVEVSVLEVF